MRFITKMLSAVALCILASGCTVNATSSGQMEDKQAAEDLANDLYSALSENNYPAAEKLFGEKFFAVTPKDSLRMMFTRTRETLGEFESNTLVNSETRDIMGTNSHTDYVVVYNIEYSKHKAVETITMLKEDGEEKPKIVGYNVQSDGFLKWN